MKKDKYLIAWVIFGMALAGSAPESHAGGDPAKGKPAYERYCLLCHGPQGRGDGPQGQLMNPPAANFRSPGTKSKPDADLLESIQEGHPKTAMTDWKKELSEEDMTNVLAYIRDLSGKPEKGF